MNDGNRLWWFEWAAGLVGTAFFLSLGVLAISQRHIVLGSRFSFKLVASEGIYAVFVGVVLIGAAWFCFNLLLRTTRFRRMWQGMALAAAALVAALAYGDAFDF